MRRKDSLKNAALVIIDMQNLFWNPQGNLYKRGYKLLNKKFTQNLLKKANLQWEEDFIGELKILEDGSAYVIEKKTYDIFFKTNIDELLIKNKIKKIIFTGILTNVCVESSMRSSFLRGYSPVLLSDCTTTYSNFLKRSTIINIKRHFGHIQTIQEYIEG